MTASLLLLSCLTAAVPGVLPSDPPVPRVTIPARAIPASSYLALEFAGLNACREAADAVPLVGMVEAVAAPGRAAFFTELRRELGAIDRDLAEFGVDRKVVRQILQRPVAVGIGRLTFFDDAVLPSIAVAIDVAGCRQDAETAIAVMAGRLGDGRRLVFEKREELGATWYSLQHTRKNGNLVAAIRGDLLLLGNSPMYLRECLRTESGDLASVVGLAVRERGCARLDATPLLVATINPPPLESLLPYEVLEITAALGIDGCEQAFLGVGMDGAVSRELLHISTESRPGGVVSGLLAGRLDRLAARYCPPDTLLFTSGRLDLPTVVAGFERLISGLPTEARHEVEREIDREVRRELENLPDSAHALASRLGASRGQWTLAVPTPGLSKPIPHGLLVLQLDDPAGFAADLTRLLTDCDLATRTIEFRGTEIWSTTIEQGMRFTPSFCVHDGALICSSDLRVLKAALVRCQDDSRANLADTETLGAFGVASFDPSMQVVVHVREAVIQFWPAVQAIVRGLPEEEIREFIDAGEIPEPDEMLAVLGDIRIGVARSDRGIEVVSESSLGPATLLAVFGKLLDDALAMSPRGKIF